MPQARASFEQCQRPRAFGDLLLIIGAMQTLLKFGRALWEIGEITAGCDVRHNARLGVRSCEVAGDLCERVVLHASPHAVHMPFALLTMYLGWLNCLPLLCILLNVPFSAGGRTWREQGKMILCGDRPVNFPQQIACLPCCKRWCQRCAVLNRHSPSASAMLPITPRTEPRTEEGKPSRAVRWAPRPRVLPHRPFLSDSFRKTAMREGPHRQGLHYLFPRGRKGLNPHPVRLPARRAEKLAEHGAESNAPFPCE